MTIRSDLIDNYVSNYTPKPIRRSCDRHALTPYETLNLMYFTVSQKFARDLYITAYQTYGGSFIPKIIGYKEGSYLKCIKAINKVGIKDPTENTSVGEFKLPVFQNAYNTLNTRVTTSQTSAMATLSMVEETDIKDLYASISEVTKKEAKDFFTKLLYEAIENFQTVVFKIEQITGQPYTAQVLTQAQVDKLLGR